jgi:hypothetical protein
MNTRAQSIQAWHTARGKIRGGGMVTIRKNLPFPHPLDAGAQPTASWPIGQLADYALELKLGAAPLLIREFSDRYEAVVQSIQLTEQAVRFAESNPTAALYLGGTLLGAAIGTAITHKREGALLGAGLGLLIAALLNASIHKSQKPS